MMNELESKRGIVEALGKFQGAALRPAALGLFRSLGYTSDRLVEVSGLDEFRQTFDPESKLNPKHALLEEWETVEFLFQLTQDQIQSYSQPRILFSSEGAIEKQRIESYLFFAVRLRQGYYTRTQLASITRAVNRLFPMPAMLLFQHGSNLTLAVINREISRRDESRDVLRKVTLVKDITSSDPLRAHIDILSDLSFASLHEEFSFHNFVGLHGAWEKRLDSYQLSERFYRDIANWYFWAQRHPGSTLPYSVQTDEERSMFFIRLITRLIFCWFLQEKGLMPRSLFRTEFLRETLKDLSPSACTYYQAVLQNLFFGTLNQDPEERAFRSQRNKGWYDQNRGITNIYRYKELLRDPDGFLDLLKTVPFVNGGLFDCLDEVFTKREGRPNVRMDGFSDNPNEAAALPNELFFGDERRVNLADVYQDARRKSERVRGLVEILSRYKFTVEENTPLEEEIALDPELLGRVFENLLASYNPDTRTTARKATGSFYTRREVVNFMVDETLIAYFLGKVTSNVEGKRLEEKLRSVFSVSVHDFQNPFTAEETIKIIEAIDGVKILDPACGSGAFPMGALHRLVDLLAKLDPNNRHWKEQQLERARADRELAEQMQDNENREHAHRDVEERIKDIERSFNTHFHELDYARKLFLIENCIYGVDIQPIACQLAKLRFFVALLVDQKVDPEAPNHGVRPLPNLETRVVAADALTPIDGLRKHQIALFEGRVQKLREDLDLVRHRHFSARSGQTKAKCRQDDARLREEIANALNASGLPVKSAEALAGWDPYDQDAHATFFDPAWMFSLKEGFDIVLGNPPYVRQEQIKEQKAGLKENYDVYSGTADLYVYFYERAIRLLKSGGAFSFISSNKWFRSGYGEKLRNWLIEQTRLLRLIDFGDAPVFKSIAYPCIVVLTKDEQAAGTKGEPAKNKIRVLNWNPEKPVEQFPEIFRQESFTLPQASLKPDGWRLESGVKLRLLDRIRAAGLPLGNYVNGRFYRGILTGLNEAYVIDRGTRDRLIEEHPSSAEVIKPFLRGRDVKRWQVEFEDQYLIRIESSENAQHAWSNKKKSEAENVFARAYPAIHEWFQPLRGQMVDRYDQGKYFWELRACAYWQEFDQPKIIVPAITDKMNFAPDHNGFYSNNKTTIFVPPSVGLALAVANSSVAFWLAQQTFATKQGGFFDCEPRYSSQIPIPEVKPHQQAALEQMVDYLIRLKGTETSDSTGASAYFEQLVNGLVYELFFSDELHEQRLLIFKYVEEARLPDLNRLPENQRKAALRESFERISDLNHPIRSCLFSLQALEIVRIIEGEA